MNSETGRKLPHCILITGSSGKIGKAFIDRFHDRFTELAFDREDPSYPPAATQHIISCDMSSDESVREALKEAHRLGCGHIVSVIHLAGYYDSSGKPSPLYNEITVEGTERLLRGLQNFEVEQFILTSTMLVHDSVLLGDLISEEDPLNPKWDYPKSKVAAEAVMHRERAEIPTVSLRLAEVYDGDTHSIPLSRHIRRIYERKFFSHFFPGEVEHGQAFLHMDDLVEALYLTIVRRHTLPSETVLLLGEPDVMSFEELQSNLARLIHGRSFWITFPIPKALVRIGSWVQEKILGKDPFIRPGMISLADDHFALDISQAKLLLHWEPRHSLRASLPGMVDKLKADPQKWYKENGLAFPKI